MGKPKKIDGRIRNGQNPNSIAALRAHKAPNFVPGVCPNPGGRPKKVMTDALSELMEESFPNDKEKRQWKRIIAEGIARKAAKGDASAFNAVADRVEGKVTQHFAGPDDGGIPVKMSLTELDEQLSNLIRQLAAR